MRLVLETHHGCYLLDALATVMQHNLSRTDNLLTDKLVGCPTGQTLTDAGEILWRDTEEISVPVHIEIRLSGIVQMLHEPAQDVLAGTVCLAHQFSCTEKTCIFFCGKIIKCLI